GALQARRLQPHQLGVMHTRRRGYRACFLGRHEGWLVAQIDHDDFVADAVHLGKRVVGERAHGIFSDYACLIWRMMPGWPVRQICAGCPPRPREAQVISVMGGKAALGVSMAVVRHALRRREPGHLSEARPLDTATENTE